MPNFSRTWWGQRFLAALEAFTDPGRLARGRAYAADRRILDFKLVGGKVTCVVRGNINPYFGVFEEPRYTTRVSLTAIPDEAWKGLLAVLGARADLVTRLLLNEVPEGIEEVFAAQQLHLLPAGARDISTTCSCPDWANPCKHVAGVYYRLAAMLDEDPVLLFELRGLPRAQLQKQLAGSPLGRILAAALAPAESAIEPATALFSVPVREPLDPALGHREFWVGARRLPPPPAPAESSVAAVLVKTQGDFPAFWPKEQSFIGTMEAFYQRVRTKNTQLK